MKRERYQALVQKRKQCRLCRGLTNCSEFPQDSDEIGPWSLWHGDIDADILIVAQDWGDVAYFRKHDGKDEPSGNPTNDNLRKLMRHGLGIDIGTPGAPRPCPVFLTNTVLCLKQKGLQEKVQEDWVDNCSREFLKPLIEIIRPRYIIALGGWAAKSILHQFGRKGVWSLSVRELLRNSPYSLGDMLLLPVYHCGDRGVKINRSWENQKKDWERVGRIIREDGWTASEGGGSTRNKEFENDVRQASIVSRKISQPAGADAGGKGTEPVYTAVDAIRRAFENLKDIISNTAFINVRLVAEKEARDLLYDKVGEFDDDDFRKFFALCSREFIPISVDSGGPKKTTYTRFADMNKNIPSLVSQKDALNPWFEAFWFEKEDALPGLLDGFWKSDIKNAGTGVPT